MAKQNGNSGPKPVTPDFRDVDQEATKRAAAAVQGGRQEPLNVPENARRSVDKKGVEYSRWTERLVVESAYRTVTESGLMDVVVISKIRQSEENDGSKVFGHYYINNAAKLPDGHDSMNDRSYGSLLSLLTSTGALSAAAAEKGLKGTVLNKMFPPKGQPGVESPLVGKLAVGNIVQQLGPQKEKKTNKPVLDKDGEPILQKRDNVESYLPDAPAGDEDE